MIYLWSTVFRQSALAFRKRRSIRQFQNHFVSGLYFLLPLYLIIWTPHVWYVSENSHIIPSARWRFLLIPISHCNQFLRENEPFPISYWTISISHILDIFLIAEFFKKWFLIRNYVHIFKKNHKIVLWFCWQTVKFCITVPFLKNSATKKISNIKIWHICNYSRSMIYYISDGLFEIGK